MHTHRSATHVFVWTLWYKHTTVLYMYLYRKTSSIQLYVIYLCVYGMNWCVLYGLMLPYDTCACVLDTGICITKPQCIHTTVHTHHSAYHKIETLKLIVSKIKWKIPVRVIRYGWTTRPDREIGSLKHTAVQTHSSATHVSISQNLKHTIICQCKWTQSANQFRR